MRVNLTATCRYFIFLCSSTGVLQHVAAALGRVRRAAARLAADRVGAAPCRPAEPLAIDAHATAAPTSGRAVHRGRRVVVGPVSAAAVARVRDAQQRVARRRTVVGHMAAGPVGDGNGGSGHGVGGGHGGSHCKSAGTTAVAAAAGGRPGAGDAAARPARHGHHARRPVVRGPGEPRPGRAASRVPCAGPRLHVTVIV